MNRSNKTRNLIFLLIWLPIGALYFIFAQKYGTEKMKVEYQFFNSSNISGVIEDVNCTNGGCHVIVNGSVKKFTFFPYTSALNNNKIFSHTAQSGDSVIKMAYSDSLILIKKNKKYVYTFQKPKQ